MAFQTDISATVPFTPHTKNGVLDLCALGIITRGFPCVQEFLAQNSHLVFLVTPQASIQDRMGEDLIAATKPEYAELLRSRADALFARRAEVIDYSANFVAEVDKLLGNERICHDLRLSRGFEMRISIAAAGRLFRAPILSGNRFFRRLAEHIEMPSGVFDMYRNRWIVPPTTHN